MINNQIRYILFLKENPEDIHTIDSCEYIECDYGMLDQRVYSLTHKGNCKNPKTKTKHN